MLQLFRICIVLMFLGTCNSSHARAGVADSNYLQQSFFHAGLNMGLFTKKPNGVTYNDAHEISSTNMKALAGVSMGYCWHRIYAGMAFNSVPGYMNITGSANFSYYNANTSFTLQGKVMAGKYASFFMGAGADYSYFELKQSGFGTAIRENNLYFSPRAMVIMPLSHGHGTLSHLYCSAELACRFLYHSSTTYPLLRMHTDNLIQDPGTGNAIYSGLYCGLSLGYLLGR